LKRGFERALNTEFKREESLTAQEQELTEKLRMEKYANNSWNFKGRL